MRRIIAIVAALGLMALLAGSTFAGSPSSRVNRVVGNFDILDWDGTLVGHVVVNYQEPTHEVWVPGTLDVTWVPGTRFAYPQPPFGAKVSHTVLTAAWFGPGPGIAGAVETGTTGSMCDFGAEWNATCHDFTMVIEKDADPKGQHLVAFGYNDWENNPAEWYVIGQGAFAVTYVGETGS